MLNSFPQAVTIAGSDCDGSAGLQADLNTFQAQKVYGMSIVTAAVAGNSYGIFDSVALTTDFIDAQFKALATDFKIRAVKTGMLTDQATIECVVKNLQHYQWPNLVLDPVIITKHQALLLETKAYQTLIKELWPLALLVTPNFFEAQKLSGLKLATSLQIQQAAQRLQELGAKNVLIKGTHDDPQQQKVRDYVLFEDGTEKWLEADLIHTTHVNGTGDTLSAAIAAQLALGKTLDASIQIAENYTHQAIAQEIAVGHKYGPINHLV
ncbi:bifunctional hydroxymethylpyrimidine kinase/phosphomethylpyrimidine kinase [Bombilactobacillus bombi]|uniref:bifunctional hydroxymethylpyrimidine kinase/phosphomethylpyrimidine kinase n=1 Tax=Bombilactobacillus bombi TaxID=1303590 RepID=UPI0015E5AC27|nr:bifunctional hydroxymethylpyrimidine kinase/phosphomethylpyrimidine kinase [Bombilactobacillus bombi]MBA1433787.1 bifunctional hydroxymethylpyrimidine kinase/phosphomethylpyrimidine kinase [Bombilactobacillus bombi]